MSDISFWKWSESLFSCEAIISKCPIMDFNMGVGCLPVVVLVDI